MALVVKVRAFCGLAGIGGEGDVAVLPFFIGEEFAPKTQGTEDAAETPLDVVDLEFVSLGNSV